MPLKIVIRGSRPGVPLILPPSTDADWAMAGGAANEAPSRAPVQSNVLMIFRMLTSRFRYGPGKAAGRPQGTAQGLSGATGQKGRRISRRISLAALCPGAPVTPPPGWVPE